VFRGGGNEEGVSRLQGEVRSGAGQSPCPLNHDPHVAAAAIPIRNPLPDSEAGHSKTRGVLGTEQQLLPTGPIFLKQSRGERMLAGREGTLVRGVSHRAKGRESGVSLAPPVKLRRLQEALYTKAKQEPAYRFYLRYDKGYRPDIRAHAYALSKQKGGAPGVDGVTFEDIEAAGREPWLAAGQEALRTETYRPHPVRRVWIPKPGGTGERPPAGSGPGREFPTGGTVSLSNSPQGGRFHGIVHE